MKEQLTSFDIFCAVKELQHRAPEYLEKIYTANDGQIVFRFSGKSDFEIHCINGSFISISNIEHAQEPDAFVMELRKYIQGRRIERISQVGFDRIIEINMGAYALFIEMFGEGNVVLVEDGITVCARKYRKHGQREIARGTAYKQPPQKILPWELTAQKFEEIARNAKYDVRRNLITQFWLGGICDEIMFRAGVNPDAQMRELNTREIEAIVDAIRCVFEQTNELKPSIVYENSTPLDVISIDYKIYENHSRKFFESFLEAIGAYVQELRLVQHTKQIEKERMERIVRIEKKLEMQKQEYRSALEEYQKWKMIGDFIYAHYDDLMHAITNDAMPCYAEKIDDKLICRVDGLEFEINLDASLNDNAQRAYANAADARKKAAHIKEAMKNTEIELEQTKNEKIEIQVVQTQDTRPHRKTFWFENFRWFISSDGFIVISGYDAASNDKVVKKYLGDFDRYVHADIHGSPSTVIKSGGRSIPDSTTYEACVFTVCYSQAWKQSVGSVDAYWVKPEQVSKTPTSGEFVPRGAWIIRGTKNYVRNLNLELGIGYIEYENTMLLMCAPLSAIKKQTADYVVIVPGNTEKEQLVKTLAVRFKEKIEVLQKMLPAGKTDVRA